MLKIIIISLALFVLGVAALEAHAQTVKTWVDEEGVTHYSDQEPPGDGADVKEIQVPDASVSEFESENVTERLNKQLQQLEKDRKAREQEAEASKKARDVEEALEREPIEGVEKKKKSDRTHDYDYKGPYPKPRPGPFPEKYPKLPESMKQNPLNPENQSN